MGKNGDGEWSFKERLAWGERQRKLLDSAFYPHFCYQGRWVYFGGNSPGTVHFQRERHIDVGAMVRVTSGPESVTIDEKIDSQLRPTFLLETESDREQGKPGWMAPGVSKSDLLLWAFPTKRPLGMRVYVLRLDPLRTWFYRNLRSGWFPPAKEVPNREGRRTWTTLGYSVAIKWVPSEFFVVHARQIEEQLGLFGWDELDELKGG